MNPPLEPEERRLRVLLLAELANPEWVSVPLVGWSHARALAALADTHLVTQVRNREAILRAGLREGTDFTAIDSERLESAAWKLGEKLRGGEGKGFSIATAFSSFTYYYFEHLVWQRFGADIKAGRYDVVHRLTPLSPATPSLLAERCRKAGVPFVLGPLNGGVPWPKGFGHIRNKEREWLSHLRQGIRLLPGYRSTRRASAAILAGSRITAQELATYADRVVYLPENAVDVARFALRERKVPQRPLRVAFVGRLVPLKAVELLLYATADLVRQGELIVDIIGDGPEKPSLEALVAQEQMGAGVLFAGWVAHGQLQERLAQSDLFGFASIREFGGAVVLEAMALGLVPVVLDYGGPGELVSPATGFAIPMGSKEQIIEGFRKTFEALVKDPSVLPPMAQKARARVEQQFTWPAKARQTFEVYRWVTGRRSDKPDFGMPLTDSPEAPSDAPPHGKS